MSAYPALVQYPSPYIPKECGTFTYTALLAVHMQKFRGMNPIGTSGTSQVTKQGRVE